MKKLITLLLMFGFGFIQAQDKLICENVKNLGRFNFNTPMDFSIPLYEKDINKCKYVCDNILFL